MGEGYRAVIQLVTCAHAADLAAPGGAVLAEWGARPLRALEALVTGATVALLSAVSTSLPPALRMLCAQLKKVEARFGKGSAAVLMCAGLPPCLSPRLLAMHAHLQQHAPGGRAVILVTESAPPPGFTLPGDLVTLLHVTPIGLQAAHGSHLGVMLAHLAPPTSERIKGATLDVAIAGVIDRHNADALPQHRITPPVAAPVELRCASCPSATVCECAAAHAAVAASAAALGLDAAATARCLAAALRPCPLSPSTPLQTQLLSSFTSAPTDVTIAGLPKDSATMREFASLVEKAHKAHERKLALQVKRDAKLLAKKGPEVFAKILAARAAKAALRAARAGGAAAAGAAASAAAGAGAGAGAGAAAASLGAEEGGEGMDVDGVAAAAVPPPAAAAAVPPAPPRASPVKLPALKALRRPPPPVAASHRALAQPLGLIFVVALTSQGGGLGGSTLLPFLTDEVGAPFVAGLVAGAAAASAGSGGGGAAAPAGVAAAAGAGPAAGAAPAAVPALVVQTPAAYLAARARGTCVVVAPLKVALSAIPAALDGCLPRSADVAPTALAVLCDATGTSYDGVAAALAGSTERSKKEVVTREWRLLRFTSAGGLHWAYGAATYLGAASSRGTGRPMQPSTPSRWCSGVWAYAWCPTPSQCHPSTPRPTPLAPGSTSRSSSSGHSWSGKSRGGGRRT